MTLEAIQHSQIRIGSCGYSYPGTPPKGWYGVFYPPTKGRGFDELEYYARFFDTVEINSTFYRPPAPAMSSAWAAKTPDHFTFAVKAWQKFTHAKKIGAEAGAGEPWQPPDDSDVEAFKSGIVPLERAGKLGVLLFQYPASFYFNKEAVERLRWTMEAFADCNKVVELRHRSWSENKNEVQALLAQSGTGWAVIDEPKFYDSIRQELEPAGKILYVRLHGRNQAQWWKHGESWERYDYFYSAQQIRSLSERLTRLAPQSPNTKIHVLFNNHARGQAVANALMLKHEIGQMMQEILPEGLVRAYPDLAALAPMRSPGALL